jgi:hypothetical protein
LLITERLIFSEAGKAITVDHIDNGSSAVGRGSKEEKAEYSCSFTICVSLDVHTRPYSLISLFFFHSPFVRQTETFVFQVTVLFVTFVHVVITVVAFNVSAS